MKVFKNEKLEIFINEEFINFSAIRSGNPFRTQPPSTYDTPPISIEKLAISQRGTGHDAFLSGIFVYCDWKINKIMREQLLRYNFINVISSQSLMHCFDKFKKEGLIDKNIKSVDDLPLGFEYWISFCCNYRQLKTIYSQRKTHKRPEWREFCEALKTLPNHHWITGEKNT